MNKFFLSHSVTLTSEKVILISPSCCWFSEQAWHCVIHSLSCFLSPQLLVFLCLCCTHLFLHDLLLKHHLLLHLHQPRLHAKKQGHGKQVAVIKHWVGMTSTSVLFIWVSTQRSNQVSFLSTKQVQRNGCWSFSSSWGISTTFWETQKDKSV